MDKKCEICQFKGTETIGSCRSGHGLCAYDECCMYSERGYKGCNHFKEVKRPTGPNEYTAMNSGGEVLAKFIAFAHQIPDLLSKEFPGKACEVREDNSVVVYSQEETAKMKEEAERKKAELEEKKRREDEEKKRLEEEARRREEAELKALIGESEATIAMTAAELGKLAGKIVDTRKKQAEQIKAKVDECRKLVAERAYQLVRAERSLMAIKTLRPRVEVDLMKIVEKIKSNPQVEAVDADGPCLVAKIGQYTLQMDLMSANLSLRNGSEVEIPSNVRAVSVEYISTLKLNEMVLVILGLIKGLEDKKAKEAA